MGTFLLIVSLTAAITLSIICAATEIPSRSVDFITDKDDVYLQLLGRVENLEKRDQEQQIEINQLRAELITEKQRTSKLEGRLSRILVSSTDRHENDAAKAMSDDANISESDAVEALQQDQHHADDRKTEQTTRSSKTEAHESRIKRHVDMPVIAFHATLSSDSLHMGAYESIAFDYIVENIGSAYNANNGTFIAPCQGVYVFSTTISVRNHGDTYILLTRSRMPVANLYSNGLEHTFDTDSAMVVVHLSKGEYVNVQNGYANTSISGNHFSMFSGFLLYKDKSDGSVIVG